MIVHNFLPGLVEGLKRWETKPKYDDFARNYFAPTASLTENIFGDAREAYDVLSELEWKDYRDNALRLNPAREEKRVRDNIARVERETGVPLAGEVVLFAAFGAMDGYARFDEGTHRVYLAIDESAGEEGSDEYLDILECHELTHVARESRPAVWSGWGFDVRMTHDEFVENQPVIEHLFGEGFSCAISERLVKCATPWHYAYQTRESLAKIVAHSGAVDRTVHAELARGPDGDWGRLYDSGNYSPQLPVFTHYVWGWQWAKSLINTHAGGDPAKLVSMCSREFRESAQQFRLEAVRDLLA